MGIEGKRRNDKRSDNENTQEEKTAGRLKRIWRAVFRRKKPPVTELALERGLSVKITGEEPEEKKFKGDSILRYVLNGLLVFMLTYSAMDCFLSCFEIVYYKIVAIVPLLIFSMLFAMMYISKKTKRIGYVAILVGFTTMTFTLRWVVNSGFSHIMNVVIEFLEAEFNLPLIKRYAVFYSDTAMSVSVCVIVIGFVVAMLANIAVSEYMNPLAAIIVTFGIAQLGIYFDKAPSRISMSMYIASIACIAILRLARLNLTDNKREEYSFTEKKGKRRLKNVFSPQAAARAGLQLCAMIFAAVFVIELFTPENFVVFYKKTAKRSTNIYVREFALNGFRMFFKNQGTGGLNGGKLGDVDIVRLDYDTDLYATFVPIQTDRIYLRGYIGRDYTGKSWEIDEEEGRFAFERVNLTTDILRSRFELTDHGYAKAKMRITNVDFDLLGNDDAGRFILAPYYTVYEKDGIFNVSNEAVIRPKGYNREYEVNYYPYYRLGAELPLDSYLKDQDASGKYIDEKTLSDYDNYVHAYYIKVPKGNVKVVRDIVTEQGFSKNDKDIVKKLADYFMHDFNYTLRPGSTPQAWDYVNYFLLENKQGYCAHFASAAVLIFRQMGIPARYVEGYVIDATDLIDASVVEDEKASDWIAINGMPDDEDEDSPRWNPDKMRVLKVDVTDAKAHAWVEIYIDGFGWVVADVTPPRTEDEDDAPGGLGNLFANILAGNGGDNTALDNARTVFLNTFQIVMIAVAAVVVGAVIFIFGRIAVIKSRRRKRLASNNRDAIAQALEYMGLLLRAGGEKADNGITVDAYIRRFNEYCAAPMLSEELKQLIKLTEKILYSRNFTDADKVREAGEKLGMLIRDYKKQIRFRAKLWYFVRYGL